MSLKAIIFDVDGTIANTEHRGHLPACNEAFATLGIPIQWSWEQFKGMYHIAGNALRMRKSLLEWRPDFPPAELDELIEQLITLKKKFYIEKYLPDLPLREGVVEIMEQALERGIRLAVVSMSYEVQVNALLARHLPHIYPHLHPILGRESGAKTAPDSPLYRRCLAELGTAVHETLVIEDSEEGFQAAQRAGIPTAVIYNDFTFGKNFAGAVLVARSLKYFTLSQLEALCLPEGEEVASRE